MSTSQHPVALRLERFVGGDTRLLALVMGLPLIDGIFVALIVSGALNSPLAAVQIGLLIFGGSAMLAVILAEMSGTPREQVAIVLLVGVPLIAIAAVQAALAPTIESVLHIDTFERFAALVILAIAAKTASATIGEYLPGPGVIIGLGLLASLDPAGAEVAILSNQAWFWYAILSSVVGVSFALAVALAGPYLRRYMALDRFRFGSAVALGILPISILADTFEYAPLAVLIVAALFAIDPSLGGSSDERDDSDGGTPDAPTASAPASGHATDGGSRSSSSTDPVEPVDRPDEDAYPNGERTDTSGRAPWL